MTRASAASSPRVRAAFRADAGHRQFAPGTNGWTVSDLDDPVVERQWSAGAYELINGVLTHMAPAYFDGAYYLDDLEEQVREYGRQRGSKYRFLHEVDIVIDEHRLVRADAVMADSSDRERFRSAAAAAGKKRAGRQRIYVPPTLIIESVSPGHEAHDRHTKLAWYAEFGVPHYWMLDSLRRSLECHVLADGKYALAASGTPPSKVDVPLLDGLKIDLRAIFSAKR